MSIYAISDLHLSYKQNKPMYIFGENWLNHEEKIKKDWLKKVKDNDLVLLPGDLSWATYLEEMNEEFKFLENLPGTKLLLKGNHDYWWTTLTNMKKYLKENNYNTIDFIHNNSYLYEDYIICGTRGWSYINKDDERLLKREEFRLELSLEDGIKKYGEYKKIIVMLHYPPIINKNVNIDFIKIMKKYNVEKCIYGHLHGSAHKEMLEKNIDGINLELVSCDYTNFKLIKIL